MKYILCASIAFSAIGALLMRIDALEAAESPTVDQLVQAYAGAPWVLVPTEDGSKYVCIDELSSRRVDWIVTRIYEAAKGAKCS